MAIDFGNTQMEGSIAPSVVVQNPVVDNSGAILAESLGGAAKTIGAIAGSIFQQGQVDANGKILSAYENELLNLADAVDQGTMERDEAMLQARSLRRSYLSNAPSLQEDFDKVWSSFAKESGLGHVVIEGTRQEKLRNEQEQAAAKLGYTPQEFDLFQSRTRQATELNYQLETIKAQGGILTETQKLEATKVVVGLADAAFPAAQSQINKAKAAIEAGGDRAAITAELNTSLGASIAQLQYMSGPADAAYIVTPITNALESFNQWSNKTIETSVMDATIKNAQQQYAMMYTLDPKLGPIIAQSALLKSIGLENTAMAAKLWDAESLQYLKQVLDPASAPPNLLQNDEGAARFTKNIRDVAATVNASTDQAVVDEAMTALNNAIDGVYINERAAKDGALGFKDTVEMLGSPEIANLIQRGGGITAAHSDKFVGVLQENYEKELIPAIQKYWESSPLVNAAGGESAVANDTPMKALLTPVWNGSAVEFIPAVGYENDARVIRLAEEANTGDNSMGIPINNLINAYANVSGVDAKTIWEQDFAGRLFNLDANGEKAPVVDRVTKMLDDNEAKASSSFSIGDFNPDTLEPLAEYVSQNSALTSALPPIDPQYTDVEGVDYASYLPSIRASESGGNDSAKNPTSTATGRYQFLKSTWDGLVNKYPNSGLTADGRLDPQQQEVAIRLFTAENARYLKNNGVSLSNGTLYAAHFLGAGDAVKVLNASPSDMVAAHVPARVIDANPFLRNMTVARFNSWVNEKGNA